MADVDNMEVIGRRFREWRIETENKTGKEIAVLLGTNEHTISKIENGRMYPTVDILCKMYRRRDVSMNWLLGGDANGC